MQFTEKFDTDKKTITIEFEKDKDDFIELKIIKTGVELLRLITMISRITRKDHLKLSERITELENDDEVMDMKDTF